MPNQMWNGAHLAGYPVVICGGCLFLQSKIVLSSSKSQIAMQIAFKAGARLCPWPAARTPHVDNIDMASRHGARVESQHAPAAAPAHVFVRCS